MRNQAALLDDEDDIPTKYIPGQNKPKYYPRASDKQEREDLDIYSNTSSMQMDPPGNNRNDIRNDIFAKRVPK